MCVAHVVAGLRCRADGLRVCLILVLSRLTFVKGTALACRLLDKLQTPQQTKLLQCTRV